MAAFATVLNTFSDLGNTRTYEKTSPAPVHSATKPNIVLQKRKTPSGSQTIMEDSLTLVMAVEDSDGNVLPQRATFEFKVRRPISAVTADIDAGLVTIRDIIAGDETADMVTFQRFVSGS